MNRRTGMVGTFFVEVMGFLTGGCLKGQIHPKVSYGFSKGAF